MMEVAINSVARMNGFTPSTTITAVAAAAAAATGGGYSTPTTTCSGKNGRIFTFNSASLSSLAATTVASLRTKTAAGVGSHKRTNQASAISSSSSLLALSAMTAGIVTCGAEAIPVSNITTTTLPSTTTSSSSSSSLPTPSATFAPTSTPSSSSTLTSNSKNYAIPSDILDDLASRFIINVPDDERNNLIRICFQIELAHWFYLDFFCAIVEKKLQPCGIKQFAMQLFQHIPFLQKNLSTVDKILEDWKNYKLSVPTYGAILISEDLSYVLLVQSYFAKSSWGFPKGKVNETEDPIHCATREVFEETGYDITGLIVPSDFIDAVINDQYIRLYIVRNVPLQTHFSPRTRNEIKCCDWFPIDSLPINKNDAISKNNLGINANSFFMIMPFVKRLKKWVNDNRSGIETRRKYPPTNTNNLNSNSTTTSATSSAAVATQSGVVGYGMVGALGALTTSPPTGDGGGVAGGGGGEGGVCNGSSPTSMLMVKQNNLTNISSSSCKKDMDSNMRIYNENIALNNGNGSVSNYLNNNNNNSNNQNNGNGRNNNKRQRHKSMGDIDGIKLNISANTNSNNCKSNQGGTKASNNSGNKHSNKVQQHQQQCNAAMAGTTSSTTSSAAPPKRQLFHSQSQSGTSNMSNVYSEDWIYRKPQMITFDSNRKDPKLQQKEKDRDNKNAASNNNAGCDKQPKKVNNRQRTKSQGASSNNNQQLQQSSATPSSTTAGNQNKQPLLRTAKEKQQQQQRFTSLTPPPPSSPTTPTSQQQSPNEKTRSVSLSSATVATSQKIKPRSATPQQTANTNSKASTAASNQIMKFNPNFDSWTNFSFTKNFIANVFC